MGQRGAGLLVEHGKRIAVAAVYRLLQAAALRPPKPSGNPHACAIR